MKNIFKFIISISIPLIIGFAGSFFTASSVDSWFTTINKPSFNPPGWIFAPVWTTLYILIGLSFYLVWRNNFGEARKKVISIYFMQLLFNLLWSVLFFGLKSPLLGFIDIILLLIFIIANTIIFFKISKIAGYLFVPYLLWVSFASILNFSIYLLN